MKVLTQDNFKDSISKGVVLVDMYADWCGPCRMLSPMLERLSETIEGVEFCKLDVDAEPYIASEYGVMSIPTVIIFKDGKEFKRIIGLYPEEAYIDALNQAKQ